MQLRVLGCSGGIGAGLRTTSFLLDETVLLDAGTGVGDLSLAQMQRIRHIFLTHSHLDHIASVPTLVDTIFNTTKEPVILHAQPATIEALQDHIFNWVIWPDFTRLPDAEAPVLRFAPMRPGEVATVEGKTFHMIPVNHAVPGVAYCVHHRSAGFCFSGDTTTNDTLWDALNAQRHLELLIVECAYADHDENLAKLAKHYCPKLLAADLQKLQHRPRVALSHAKPGDEQRILEECRSALVAFDLMQLRGGEVLQL